MPVEPGNPVQGKGGIGKSAGTVPDRGRTNPRNILALGSLGDCLMALEQYDEAIRVYKKALKILPEGMNSSTSRMTWEFPISRRATWKKPS